MAKFVAKIPYKAAKVKAETTSMAAKVVALAATCYLGIADDTQMDGCVQ